MARDRQGRGPVASTASRPLCARPRARLGAARFPPVTTDRLHRERRLRRPGMFKVLNPTVHGALDYALALAFIFSPGVLGFTHTAAVLSQIFGVIYLGVSLLTRYPLGALRVIPFPVHGLIE